jgi:hypothetical protein
VNVGVADGDGDGNTLAEGEAGAVTDGTTVGVTDGDTMGAGTAVAGSRVLTTCVGGRGIGVREVQPPTITATRRNIEHQRIPCPKDSFSML